MQEENAYELRQFRIHRGTHKKLKVLAALRDEHMGDILKRLVDAEMNRACESRIYETVVGE